MELFFDKETSGFISKKIPLDSQDNGWTIQLAAILSTKDRIYQEHSMIIKGGNRSMDYRAEAVHGISVEESNIGGVTEVYALTVFANLLRFNPIKICHNIAFDFGHIDAMVARNVDMLTTETRSAFYLEMDECCTMKVSTSYCGFKNKAGRPKWPRLEELHNFLFSEDFDGAHDALADVRATRRCYYELVERGVI